ncbi:MAG: hypothetical protein HYX91_03195 [Chloroflexi bacterium]|nr:hypothetical protein [Chloroflexota bacterium]
MTIEWLRDLVLIIFAAGATIVIIIAGVLMLLLYTKVRPILNFTRKATRSAANVSSFLDEELSRPSVQTAAIIGGIVQILGLISRIRGGRKK